MAQKLPVGQLHATYNFFAECECLLVVTVYFFSVIVSTCGMPMQVLVQKCKYLDETKCAGICIHTCKIPTQAFMNGDMGVRLTMEPNYENFSCQFNFGVNLPPAAEDPALKTPCLAVCPTAASRSSIRNVVPTESQCPQVTAHI